MNLVIPKYRTIILGFKSTIVYMAVFVVLFIINFLTNNSFILGSQIILASLLTLSTFLVISASRIPRYERGHNPSREDAISSIKTIINDAEESIYIAAAWLDHCVYNRELLEILKEKKRKGVVIRVLFGGRTIFCTKCEDDNKRVCCNTIEICPHKAIIKENNFASILDPVTLEMADIEKHTDIRFYRLLNLKNLKFRFVISDKYSYRIADNKPDNNQIEADVFFYDKDRGGRLKYIFEEFIDHKELVEQVQLEDVEKEILRQKKIVKDTFAGVQN